MHKGYFEPKQWSQEELDLMIAKAVKPLQERIDVLERENERLAENHAKNWNDLVQMIKARTDNHY